MAKYVGAQPRVSGNRIDGGTITTFQSTGIDDTASTTTNLTITDTTQTQTGVITNSATSGSHNFDTDTFVIDTTNDRIGINVASPTVALDIVGDGINIFYTDDGATASPTITLTRDSNTPAVADILGKFKLEGKNSADETVTYAEMYGHIKDPTDGAEEGEFDFNVMSGGTLASVLMLTPDEVTVNDGQVGLDFHVKGNANDNLLFVNTATSKVGIGTTSPTEILHVVGDVKIDGTITFSDQAAGSGAATFTIQDENNADNAANARLNLTDSDSDILGTIRLTDGDMVVGADDQLILATDTNNSYGELKSTVMYAHKRLPEAVRVSNSSNLTITPLSNPEYFSEQTACTIASSNSGDMSSFSVGDVCKIEGCTNAANNQLTRIMAISGDTLTVHGFRTSFVSESGGSITLSEGGGPCMHIPPYVNFTYASFPQNENTSRVATMRYVRTAISELIDSSPGALDTLNELAAAINDDANFYTTITGLIDAKTNRDFDNLTATGVEALYDYIGSFENTSNTGGSFPGAGNTITLNHDDANNRFYLDVALNDPSLTVTLTGDVTGTVSSTMTDLQDTTMSVATSIASGSVVASSLDQTGSVTNLVNGLPRATSVQNSDDLIIADASDGFALKKLARSLVAPPALGEDLGFFAIAMS